MSEEPTLGEVVRELSRIAAQMAALATRLENDRLLAAQTFVNRETYQADQRLITATFNSINSDIDDLSDARKNDLNWRRQSSFNLAVTAAGWLVTIALAVFAFTSR